MRAMAETNKIMGNIFDIQRYSINDGPGIRTTVFFKGCPLNCLWCSNPESQHKKPQLLHYANRCTKCYHCEAACPNEAITVDNEGGNIEINHINCKACGSCVGVCKNEALTIKGRIISIDDAFNEIKGDELFYRNSGGGVTFSGGEPTVQSIFLLELARKCKSYGFHTALDTCGYVSWDILKPIIETVELVLFDIKHINSTVHERITGQSNKIIFDNLNSIAKLGKEVTIRFPFIPGFNDSRENIQALGSLMSHLGLKRIDILPYHRLGVGKYKALGLPYLIANVETPSHEQIDKAMAQLKSFDLQVQES